MDKLAKSIEVMELYDFYWALLTKRQRDYFSDYYFNDYSLMEISENHGVSRNAVHDQLKKTVHKLYVLESKLKLKEQSQKRRALLALLESHVNEEGLDILKQLEKME
jgi:predicted DNA-binding protein YlxM (UPF0122 family)